MNGMDKGTAASRYAQLETDRTPFLDRARDCAMLTIPALLPPEGHNQSSQLYQPYQSVGARGVNNLASKILISQFPANSPFFRMAPDPNIRDQLEGREDIKGEIEKALATYERTILNEIESSGDRPVLFEGLKHLIVAGNVLLYIAKDGLKAFHLDRYVVRRDAMGTVVEIIVKECFDPETLPEAVRELLGSDPNAVSSVQTQTNSTTPARKTIEVYTHIQRREKQWIVHQELSNGQIVPDSRGQFALEKTPWLALRMTRIDGENYGRSYVEEYLGDLKSLEALTRAIVQGSAAAAKVLFLIKPNGSTKQSVVAKAPNGAIREGNADDVTVLQLNKFADFRMAKELIREIKTDLQFAFLLNTAAQRQAERVTAEEIRFVAQELEDALGGIYSILTQEFQLPYVQRRLALLVREGRLKKLPKKLARLKIITGLDALGRGHDRNRLTQYLGTLAELFGPAWLQLVNQKDIAERLAVADGIDTDGLLKSPDQLAKEQEQEVGRAMAQQVTEGAAPEAGKMLASQIAGAMNDSSS